jgi:hypothetical protein
MGMAVQLLGWPSIVVVAGQWVAVAVVVVAAVWIARLHRRLMTHYLRLQSLLSDLLAAMNLSLARCSQDACEADLREIERIRAAVQEAITAGVGRPAVR